MFCVLETLWRILQSLEQEGYIRNKYTCYNVIAMKREKRGNDRGSRQLKVSGSYYLIKTAQGQQLPGWCHAVVSSWPQRLERPNQDASSWLRSWTRWLTRNLAVWWEGKCEQSHESQSFRSWAHPAKWLCDRSHLVRPLRPHHLPCQMQVRVKLSFVLSLDWPELRAVFSF